VKKQFCRRNKKNHQAAANRNLERFSPGFYFDGITIHVDVDEFLRTHGIQADAEVRMLLWLEIQDIFHDVPIREIEE